MKSFINFLKATVIGVFLGLLLTYTVPQASAATAAIFDIAKRAYFVATGSANMTIGTGPSATGTFTLIAKGTPVADVSTDGIAYRSGKSAVTTINSVVPISSPTPNVNVYLPGLNVIPATATANTAAFVGVATPTPGTEFTIYNGSASSVYVKVAGNATVNGATAGGRLLLATLCTVQARYTSATNLQLDAPQCPTVVAG